MNDLDEIMWPGKPGFYDLKPVCLSPYHNPPMHLYIPPGKGYMHVCPGCGQATNIESPNITC